MRWTKSNAAKRIFHKGGMKVGFAAVMVIGMLMSETGAQLVKNLDLKTPPDVLPLNLVQDLFSIPLQVLREKLRFMFFAFSSASCSELLQPCYIVPFVAP